MFRLFWLMGNSCSSLKYTFKNNPEMKQTRLNSSKHSNVLIESIEHLISHLISFLYVLVLDFDVQTRSLRLPSNDWSENNEWKNRPKWFPPFCLTLQPIVKACLCNRPDILIHLLNFICVQQSVNSWARVECYILYITKW
jgi:hypothetical protein